MINVEKIAEKDLKTLLWDLTHHFVYTLFIVILSSVLTFALLKTLVEKKADKIFQALPKIVYQPAAPLTQTSEEELYVERGSPYDKRMNEATLSAKVIFHGPRDKKQVALTFDAEMTDGMKANLLTGKVKSSYDKKIVDILNETKTPATFFLTGMWIELYPKETREFADNPLFELGSHSYSDTSYHGFCYGLKQIPSTLRIEEIGATEKLLREHAGIDNRLFRFPGGCYTPDDVTLVQQADDVVVHWDVVGADGFNNNARQIERNVIDNVQNGSIIVLHLNGAPTAPKTADALPEIISTLKAKGFEFVKVYQLLGLPPEPRV